MIRWITAAVVLAAFFFGGWLLGRRMSRPEVVETVRIDTVFYERPQPVSVSDIAVAVNVPMFIFVENKPNTDTITNQVANQVANQDSDSISMQVIVRTLEYRDSTYYARVVGPAIGSLEPRLDYIETYNRTVVNTVTKRSRFAVTAGIGAAYTPQGFQPTIGIQAGVVLWSK